MIGVPLLLVLVDCGIQRPAAKGIETRSRPLPKGTAPQVEFSAPLRSILKTSCQVAIFEHLTQEITPARETCSCVFFIQFVARWWPLPRLRVAAQGDPHP